MPASSRSAKSSGLWFYALLLLAFVGLAVGLAFAGTADLVQKTTASGLKYQMLAEGSGAHPVPTDTVAVNYTGRLPDGTVFDSSVPTGQPAQFRLDQIIPGWTEGLQLMRPGGRARFVIPSALAYGPRGAGGIIPPDTDLTFDVELIAIAPAR